MLLNFEGQSVDGRSLDINKFLFTHLFVGLRNQFSHRTVRPLQAHCVFELIGVLQVQITEELRVKRRSSLQGGQRPCWSLDGVERDCACVLEQLWD